MTSLGCVTAFTVHCIVILSFINDSSFVFNFNSVKCCVTFTKLLVFFLKYHSNMYNGVFTSYIFINNFMTNNFRIIY